MKFKLLIIILLLVSCSTNTTKFDNRTPLNSKGFAFIFNEKDYNDRIINGKLDNSKLQISHNSLKRNALIKIINPSTNDSIVLKNNKHIKYPDFYKILITDPVAKKLNIKKELPFVEILEIKKNKSFIAKKAKIFQEEKKISSNAPVASVEISNISKNKNLMRNNITSEFFILIGKFYSKSTAEFKIS